MAEIPDMRFSLKASPGSMERLNVALSKAKAKTRELQTAVYEAQEALSALEYIVEKTTPEESTSQPDEG